MTQEIREGVHEWNVDTWQDKREIVRDWYNEIRGGLKDWVQEYHDNKRLKWLQERRRELLMSQKDLQSPEFQEKIQKFQKLQQFVENLNLWTLEQVKQDPEALSENWVHGQRWKHYLKNQEWLQGQECQEWLQWLRGQECRKWLQWPQGHDLLPGQENQEWQQGLQWLEEWAQLKDRKRHREYGRLQRLEWRKEWRGSVQKWGRERQRELHDQQ